MSAHLTPRSLSEDPAPAQSTSPGHAGVTVISGGQEFSHPKAKWKIDDSHGWLVITHFPNRTVAIYREWESMRMTWSDAEGRGGGELLPVPASSGITAPQPDSHHWVLASGARAVLVLSWMVRERSLRRKRLPPSSR